MKQKQCFLATAVGQFYTDLSEVKHDDPNSVKALKLAKRYHKKYLANDFLKGEEPLRKQCPNTELFLVRIFLYSD